RVEMVHGGFSMADELMGAVYGQGSWSSEKQVYPRASDPLPYLDALLYKVMKTGQRQPIPPDAVAGLANAGVGFWPQVRNRSASDQIFQPDYQFPATLVVVTDNGAEWPYRPETGNEQLLHCIFLLHGVMDYLSVCPIGKATTTSGPEVARML